MLFERFFFLFCSLSLEVYIRSLMMQIGIRHLLRGYNGLGRSSEVHTVHSILLKLNFSESHFFQFYCQFWIDVLLWCWRSVSRLVVNKLLEVLYSPWGVLVPPSLIILVAIYGIYVPISRLFLFLVEFGIPGLKNRVSPIVLHPPLLHKLLRFPIVLIVQAGLHGSSSIVSSSSLDSPLFFADIHFLGGTLYKMRPLHSYRSIVVRYLLFLNARHRSA